MALALADMEKLYLFACKAQTGKNVQTDLNWPLIAPTLRALIDDQAALVVACTAVSAVVGEAGSKAISDAALVASAAAIA